MATPSAAPTSWPVIISPDASPEAWSGTSLIAPTEIATNIGPTPGAEHQEPGQHVGGVRRVRARHGEQQGSGRGDDQPGRDQGARAGVREQLRGDRGTERDGRGQRQELQPGDHGGGAEDLLEVQRAEEDRADHGAGDAGHHGRRRDQGPDPPDPRRDQRGGDPDARCSANAVSRAAASGRGQGRGVGPAVAGGGLARRRTRASRPPTRVTAPGMSRPRNPLPVPWPRGHGAQRAGQDDDADGDVDEEHRTPVERAGEHPAEEDAGGDAHAGRRCPRRRVRWRAACRRTWS